MTFPFRPRDIILLAVVFSSMAAGICCPKVFTFLQPYPLLCLMILFFMSFLSIRLEAVWEALRQSSLSILSLVALKMFVLPVILCRLFRCHAGVCLLCAPAHGRVGGRSAFMSNLVGITAPGRRDGHPRSSCLQSSGGR
jgi:uncharacterized membrane protein YbhN (UPF0104 family)